MPAKIAILIAQKLADERTRKIIITIVAVVLSIIFLLVAGLQAIIALFTITLSTFLTEDTSLVGQTVALMDEARDAYVDEQMAEYRQRTDRIMTPKRSALWDISRASRNTTSSLTRKKTFPRSAIY